MEKIGIICEYNPFHNGHVYHLRKIKSLYPNSLIILVMSGYFTERGDISLISKYNKTKIALEYGIDIVLELPILYSMNSADYFADVALYTLNEIGIEKLIFGSETQDINLLKDAALIQFTNEFQNKVKETINTGLNYPTALSKVLGKSFDSNDILAISYIKTIIKNKYNIEPIAIKRTNNFKDIKSNNRIVSAENIRYKLNNGKDISKFLPNYDYKYLNNINHDKLFELLKYKIITTDDLSLYLGVDEGIESKIKKEIEFATDFSDLINRIKSKRYTFVRIKRMLMHILLGIKKMDIEEKYQYVRILGFNKNGQEYLKQLQNKNLVFKYNNRAREIEIVTSKVYYILTGDETSFLECLNKPIIKK